MNFWGLRVFPRIAVAAILIGSLAELAFGEATLNWVYSAGQTGKWNAREHWSPQRVPSDANGDGDDAIVNNGGTVKIYAMPTTITGMATTYGTAQAWDLYVGEWYSGAVLQTDSNSQSRFITLWMGDDSDGLGTYRLTNGTMQTSWVFDGLSGTGVFMQSGGTHLLSAGGTGYYFFRNFGTVTNSSVVLGLESNAYGSYTLTGGTLGASNETVGGVGTGVFTQSGGTNTVSTLMTLGSMSLPPDPNDPNVLPFQGTGTYILNKGSLNASTLNAGSGGTGTFTQNNGTAIVGATTLGGSLNSVGQYSISKGSLSMASVVVGGLGTGTFNQSGGSAAIGSSITVGTDSNGFGLCNFSGKAGSLTAADLFVGDGPTTVPGTIIGIVNQSNGRVTLTNTLTMGFGDANCGGSYSLSGGMLMAATQYVGLTGTGTFTQSGGANAVAGTIFMGHDANSFGTYNLNGGALTAALGVTMGSLGTGVFNQTGGQNNCSLGTISMADYDGNASGAYILSGGTVLSLRMYVGRAGRGSFNQSSGKNITGTLCLAGPDPNWDRWNYCNADYIFTGGTLSASQAEWVGEYGDANFIQTSGINMTKFLTLADYGGRGFYVFSGGSVRVSGANSQECVGNGGYGEFDQSGGTNTTTGLCLGNDTGYYSLSNGVLTASQYEWVGNGGWGEFYQTGGINTTGDLKLCVFNAPYRGTGNFGWYGLYGGSLRATNEYIGYGGTGDFYHFYVTNTVTNSLYVGYSAGSDGNYNLESGTLSAKNEYIGYSGEGTFNHDGGTNTIGGSLYVGYGAGSYGRYAFNGDMLSAKNEYVGYGGTGYFYQFGGTNVVGSSLYLGYTQSSDGDYELYSGARLSALNEYVGYGGSETFHLYGGTNIVRGSLYVGYTQSSDGEYELYSGALSALNEYVGYGGAGLFIHFQGTNTVGNSLYLGYTKTKSDGEYELYNGASLSALNEYVGYGGTGTLIQSGGTNTIGGSSLYIGYNAGAVGTYNLSGGLVQANGSVVIGSANASGVLNITGGSFIAPSGIAKPVYVGNRGKSGSSINALLNISDGYFQAGSLYMLSGSGKAASSNKAKLKIGADATVNVTSQFCIYNGGSSTLEMELDSATEYSVLNANGASVSLGNHWAILNLLVNSAFDPNYGQQFTLITATGGPAMTGDFGSIISNRDTSTHAFSGAIDPATNSYVVTFIDPPTMGPISLALSTPAGGSLGTSQNLLMDDIIDDGSLTNIAESTPSETPIPEPATLLLLALGGLVMVRRRRH